MENSYLKELNNIDTNKINKNNKNNFFIDVGINMIVKTIKCQE